VSTLIDLAGKNNYIDESKHHVYKRTKQQPRTTNVNSNTALSCPLPHRRKSRSTVTSTIAYRPRSETLSRASDSSQHPERIVHETGETAAFASSIDVFPIRHEFTRCHITRDARNRVTCFQLITAIIARIGVRHRAILSIKIGKNILLPWIDIV